MSQQEKGSAGKQMPGWPAKHNNEKPFYQQTTPHKKPHNQPKKPTITTKKVITLYILPNGEISFFQSIH